MFYINPPNSFIPLYKVEDCVITRLEYLDFLNENNDTHIFVGKIEYLFENSIYDNIGHFTLRLIMSTSTDFWKHWLKGEHKLFDHRLNHLLSKNIHQFFRKILRQLNIYINNNRNSSSNNKIIQHALIVICQYFLSSEILKHIMQHENSDCKRYTCQVLFKAVPDLIKQRRVDVKYGQVDVTCSNWKIILQSLFQNWINSERIFLQLYMKNTMESDSRLHLLLEKVENRFFMKFNFQKGTITWSNIDSKIKNFPLCMQHLHSILRKNHRLSHYARFYYSLFLKDSGMNIQDAIMYWRQEYRKPHTCVSGCTHNWDCNEKKFVYSIRHLYGLEGSRKNYKAPNCQMICKENSGARYEGGCPFTNFDDATLLNLLNFYDVSNEAKNLLIKTGKRQPEIACSNFMNLISKKKNNLVIQSPVEYYIKFIDQS